MGNKRAGVGSGHMRPGDTVWVVFQLLSLQEIFGM